MYSDADKTVLPLALLTIIIIGVLVGWLLKNKSKAIKQIPFILITLIMLTLEVVKIARSLKAGNGISTLPLQFCSLFMLWFCLASFGKGRVKQFGFSISFVSAIMFLVSLYVSPASIIGSGSANFYKTFNAFHTFVYHHLITLFFILIITVSDYRPRLIDAKWIFLTFTVFFLIMSLAANAFNVNFASLLKSPIEILERVRINNGYGIYLAIMFWIGAGGTTIIHILLSYFYIFFVKTKWSKRKLNYSKNFFTF